jgi:hypothetical protein
MSTGSQKKVKEATVHQIRKDTRQLVVYMLAHIEEGLLLKLKADESFEKARTGTCVVSLVESLYERAANATDSKRIDGAAAKSKFEGLKMASMDDYYKFRSQTNLNYANGVRADFGVTEKEAVEIAVGNLDIRVFPGLMRDLLGKKHPWTEISDLTEMWKFVDGEYLVWKKLGKMVDNNSSPTLPKIEFGGGGEAFAAVTENGSGKETRKNDIGTKRSTDVLDSPGGKRRADDREYKSSDFCHNFAQQGRCSWGENCRYRHESDQDILRREGYRAREQGDRGNGELLDNRGKAFDRSQSKRDHDVTDRERDRERERYDRERRERERQRERERERERQRQRERER